MTKLVNRAKMSTMTVGTGTMVLLAAEAGYQSFADAGVVDGDVVRYVIEDGTNWEIGTGTYTASGTTLTRTVSESSNAGAALNLTGSAVVYVSAVAEDFVSGGGGSVDIQEFATTGTSTWTKPAGAKLVVAECWGAGGGGGRGGTGGQAGGAGGGGGAYNFRNLAATSLPDVVTVGVGAGGTAASTFASAGGNGGTSTFGNFVVGNRGGGSVANNGSPGAGGGSIGAASTSTPGLPATVGFGGGSGTTTPGSAFGGGAGGVSVGLSSALSGGVSLYGGGGGGSGGTCPPSGSISLVGAGGGGVPSSITAQVGGGGAAGQLEPGLSFSVPSAGFAQGGGGGGSRIQTQYLVPRLEHANGLFVIRQPQCILYSSNASSWSQSTFPFVPSNTSLPTNAGPAEGKIIYDGTKWVLPSEGKFWTSPDLISWTEVSTFASSSNLIAYSSANSLYFTTNGGQIFSSPDLITWTQIFSNGTATYNDLLWDGSRLVAVGSFTGSAGYLIQTADFVTFNASSLGSTPLRRVASDGANTLVAIGGSTPFAYRSTNGGVNWSSVSTTLASGSTGDVHFANSTWVIAATSAMYSSTDGNTWTALTDPSADNFGGLRFASGVWVVTSNTSNTTLAFATANSPPSGGWITITRGFGGISTGGAGANGGLGGGGGGGGGVGTSSGGAGGNGGNGFVRVTTYF